MRFFRDDRGRGTRKILAGTAAAFLALLNGSAHASNGGGLPEGVWIIVSIVAVVLGLGALLIWLLLVRRPVKLDPRHEQLVKSMVALSKSDSEKAFYVLARALVRNGLIWESDLQSVGMGAAPTGRPQRHQPDSRGRSGSRQPRQPRTNNGSQESRTQQPRQPNQQNRSQGQQQARPQPQNQQQAQKPAPAGPVGDGSGDQDPDTRKRSSRRRRRPRRRPSGEGQQQQQSGGDKKETAT
jgi:hypothetical protein